MDLLMNGLLMAGTLFAGGYCWVLARRVRDLKSLDSGLGGAIVMLTRQVELARTTLEEARTSSRDSRIELSQLIARADGAAGPAQAPDRRGARPGACAGRGRRPAGRGRAGPPRRAPSSSRSRLPNRQGAAPQPEPRVEAAAPDIPKPRALAPIENPLRRARPAAAGPARSEDEILEALRALAEGA